MTGVIDSLKVKLGAIVLYDRCHRFPKLIIDASRSRFGICENLTIHIIYGIIFIEIEERENSL